MTAERIGKSTLRLITKPPVIDHREKPGCDDIQSRSYDTKRRLEACSKYLESTARSMRIMGDNSFAQGDDTKRISDCWLWQGSRLAKNSRKTYGELQINGGRILAHRLSYRLFVGEIPKGKMVCHRCNNEGCVNPFHLYLSDNSGNIKDAWRDGLIVSGNSKKERCPKCGSEYSVYPNQNGRRYCKPCKNEWQKRKRARAAAMKRETSE